MNRAVFLCFLTFTGCDDGSGLAEKGGRQQNVSKAAAELALTPLELTAKVSLEKRAKDQQTLKALEVRVKKAMEQYLFDPFSAEYRGLRSGRNGAVCGQVNAKNRVGAYVGSKQFVVGKEDSSVYVSKYSDGIESELYGSFAEAYMNVCASKIEANRYRVATEPSGETYDTEPDNTYSAPRSGASESKIEDPFEGI